MIDLSKNVFLLDWKLNFDNLVKFIGQAVERDSVERKKQIKPCTIRKNCQYYQEHNTTDEELRKQKQYF